MVFPIQQQRNNYPSPMHRSPNDFMFQQRNVNNGGAPSTNRNNIQSMVQRFIKPQSATANPTSTGAGGLSQTLNNVQQVLKVVQSTTPMIQEYGPMVKNLPAMYRMMKAFKQIDDTDSDMESIKESVDNNDSRSEKESVDNNVPKKNENKNKNIRQNKIGGQSTPKLYI